MGQQTIPSLVALDPTVENWDAGLQALVTGLKGALRAFKMVISSQGDINNPSLVSIQLTNAMGVELHEQVTIRIRVCTKDVLTVQPNATIAIVTGTLLESLTATKDIVVKSDANGLIVLAVTDAVAESYNLLIGKWMLSPFANYNVKLLVTHVNPLALFNSAGNPIFNSVGVRLTRGV